MEHITFTEDSVVLNKQINKSPVYRGIQVSIKLIVFTIIMSILLFFTFDSLLLKLASIILLPIVGVYDVTKNIKREKLVLQNIRKSNGFYTFNIYLEEESKELRGKGISNIIINSKKNQLKIVFKDRTEIELFTNYYWDYYHFNKFYDWLNETSHSTKEN